MKDIVIFTVESTVEIHLLDRRNTKPLPECLGQVQPSERFEH